MQKTKLLKLIESRLTDGEARDKGGTRMRALTTLGVLQLGIILVAALAVVGTVVGALRRQSRQRWEKEYLSKMDRWQHPW